MDCGVLSPKYAESSVRQGKVRVKNIDKALNYLYVVLMRLGFFDGSPKFQSLGSKDICNDEHIELATEAARQGIVLLKNDNDALPLDPAIIKTLAVVGPHANATYVMLGNYAGQILAQKLNLFNQCSSCEFSISVNVAFVLLQECHAE